MAQLIQRVIETLGAQWYRTALQDIFGFGVKTGIELPAESAGLLPQPGKKHPNGALEWSGPTPYSLAMGHNVLANSMQLLRAYAMIANGGYDVQPTFVRRIQRKLPNGEIQILLDNTKKKICNTLLLEPGIAKEITRAMKYTTKFGGSATKADVYGYTEAGKTGTSEKIIGGMYSKKDHISSFIGFTPTSHPRFVLMVVIDEPEFKYIPGVGKNQHGGQCAAPAFREIAMRTLQYLGIEPDDPHGYPKGDPRFDPKLADWFSEAAALKELYMQWNR